MRATEQILSYLGGIVLAIIMLLGTGDVVGRFAAGFPIPSTFEFICVLMVFVVWFGLPRVQSEGRHIRMTFLPSPVTD